jgi:hypothetical protein
MITGAYGYGPDYPEAMSQREAAEKQRQMGVNMGQYAHNMAQQQEKYNLGSSLEKHRQQGGVAREVQQFEKHLNALICVIDELDRRLAVATIPQPESTSHSSVPGPDGSALACQLFSFNGMLSRQINRLEAIYQGVDL